ncbi:hypothetical protein AB1Y20_005804 [Prymnesium parvum]|uniref:Tryptophan synthase n=1 Tax=Prymnesium parvum TaxID=97485 RepID=A0AB34J0V0_PRYPA
MATEMVATFAKAKAEGRAAFVGFVTAGYPTFAETVPIMHAMQAGGTDIIELGVPFTDPLADGTTIQRTNEVALHGDKPVSLAHCLEMTKQARAEGLTVPVILMGYYNPLLAYGLKKLMDDCKTSGVNGFIVVDLPPEEGKEFVDLCAASGLSYVPLLTPTSTNDRIEQLAKCASSFLYCVSLTGVTGARAALPTDLPKFVARIREHTDLPLAVGFGISTPEQVKQVAEIADGVVVGSAIVAAIDSANGGNATGALETFCRSMTSAATKPPPKEEEDTPGKRRKLRSASPGKPSRTAVAPQDLSGSHFGEFGGRYIPETLVEAHRELSVAYAKAKADPKFQAQVAEMRKQYIGGPTPMYFAKRLTEHAGGAQIWLKREELAFTGAHKINNAVGQGLLALRLGKKRIIAETGAGQHGVATATVCALLGLECVVYMGAEDVKRQSLNVFRMKMLGATVRPVASGSATLKDAINEAMRDWVTNVTTTHYLIGSAIGPHPFPTIVRDFQAVIGKESREQMLKQVGRLPDAVVACVGGGSNAIGMFHPFIDDKDVKMFGVEAAGDGLDTDRHSATLTMGKPGVLHGTRTYLLQNTSTGQIDETHSISAGLDYPGVGPEHAWLKDSGRCTYVAVTDKECLEGFKIMAKTEGILPALEPSHAIYYTVELAKKMKKDEIVLLNLCGRGDKDMHTVANAMGVKLDKDEDNK